MVNTVRGEQDASALGRVLMHEHLMIKSPGVAEHWPDLYDHDAAIATATRKVRALEAHGIDTIVDLTTPDMGREADLFQAVQAETRINLICCTGMYWLVPIYWWLRSVDELAEVLIRDITEGIQGTSVKAGILKVASDRACPVPGKVRGLNEPSLRSVARAQIATGVPITTHNGPPSLGAEQQRVFAEEGVDLSRVVIGHLGDSDDLDYLKQVMDRGSTIGMDRFGLEHPLPLATRIRVVADLCAAGYSDRMVLSHDAICSSHWAIERTPGGEFGLSEEAFRLIPDTVVPALLEAGATQGQVDAMLVGNPARLFSAASK